MNASKILAHVTKLVLVNMWTLAYKVNYIPIFRREYIWQMDAIVKWVALRHA